MKTARLKLIYLAAIALIGFNLSASSQLPVLQPSDQELAAYPSYEALVAELQQLQAAHSTIVSLHQIGETHGDDGDVRNSLDNRHLYAVKISDLPDVEDDRSATEEPDVLFIGGQHAREWISVYVALNLIRYLVENYYRDFEIRELVDNTEIWIVPLANPDGYEFSREFDRMWRKNRRANENGSFGVDLNRNFPYPLGYRWEDPIPADSFTSLEPNSEMYRGPREFSEPETQAIRNLVNRQNFRTSMSIHSYGQTILYPWGIDGNVPSEGSILIAMAERMSELVGAVNGVSYRPSQSFNPFDSSGGAYLKHGEISDWLYTEGIYAFTLELRPQSYGNGGFVLPVDQLEPTFAEVLPAALYLIDAALQQQFLAQSILPAPTRELIEAIDRNKNRHLDDDELFVLIDHWISGEVFVGTGQPISDRIFFGMIDRWVEDQPLYTPRFESVRPQLLRGTAIFRQSSRWVLSVDGANIASIDFQVFDLSGNRLLQMKERGNQLKFRLYDAMGEGLANGVYLYTVTAYGTDGRIARGQVQKFVVVR